MVLGDVNRGWEVSRNTLTAERVTIGSAENPNLASLDRLVELMRDGQFDQIAQNRAGQLIAEGHAGKVLNLRSTLLTLAGGDALPSAAISKLLSMRTAQGYAEFGLSLFESTARSAIPDRCRASGSVPPVQPRHHHLRRYLGGAAEYHRRAISGLPATRNSRPGAGGPAGLASPVQICLVDIGHVRSYSLRDFGNIASMCAGRRSQSGSDVCTSGALLASVT